MAHASLSLLLAACLVANAMACSDVYFGRASRGRLLAEGATEPWSYSQNGADWTGTCASGMKQSPIAIQKSNLTTEMPAAGRAMLQLGTAKGLRVLNTGKFIQVEWDSLSGTNASVPVKGDTWGSLFEDPASLASTTIRQVPVKPLQFHWHSTCENIVDGVVCPLELHIVTAVDTEAGAWVPESCKTAGPCLAVFGVMLMMPANPYAAGAPFYQMVSDAIPSKAGTAYATNMTDAELDLSSLLPEDTTYATFSGSLTTPPCTEGVQWHVFLNPKTELSAAQMDAFQAASATVPTEALASCPADEMMAAAGPMDMVEMACQVPSGARTSNRQIMPLHGRELLKSAPAVVASAD